VKKSEVMTEKERKTKKTRKKKRRSVNVASANSFFFLFFLSSFLLEIAFLQRIFRFPHSLIVICTLKCIVLAFVGHTHTMMSTASALQLLHDGVVDLTHVVALNPTAKLLTFRCQMCQLKFLCSFPSSENILQPTQEAHFQLRIFTTVDMSIVDFRQSTHSQMKSEKSNMWFSLYGYLIERKIAQGMYRFTAGNNTIVLIQDQCTVVPRHNVQQANSSPVCASAGLNYPWMSTLSTSTPPLCFEIHLARRNAPTANASPETNTATDHVTR
jgi:hypothetical protein